MTTRETILQAITAALKATHIPGITKGTGTPVYLRLLDPLGADDCPCLLVQPSQTPVVRTGYNIQQHTLRVDVHCVVAGSANIDQAAQGLSNAMVTLRASEAVGRDLEGIITGWALTGIDERIDTAETTLAIVSATLEFTYEAENYAL